MRKRWVHLNLYDSPEAWIRLVSTPLALSRRRNLTRQRTAPSADIDTEPAAPQDPGQRLDLEQLVRHLSREQREAVVLHYLCDLSIQETANTLGTTQSAIKNRLLRARDQLAPMMRSEERLVGNECVSKCKSRCSR